MTTAHRTTAWSVLVAAILIALVAAGCGSEARTGPAALDALEGTLEEDDVVHALPSYLPPGWELGHANERIGITLGPRSQVYEVTDYTVVWLPSHLAGNSREDSTAEDDDPQIYLISGSGYYEEVMPGDAARATRDADVDDYDDDTPFVVQDSGHAVLTFRIDGRIANLYAFGIDEQELRMVADSLETMDRQAWRERLGDRLLIEDNRVEDIFRIREHHPELRPSE